MNNELAHVDIHNSARQFAVNRQRLHFMTERILESLGLAEHELSIRFVGQKAMRQLNAKYRGKDKVTDVLSFPQKKWSRKPKVSTKKMSQTFIQSGLSTSALEEAPPEALGDIVISLAQAAKNAVKIGHGVDRETAFLIVHGVLHLCGHDHETAEEEKTMLAEQRKLMEMLSKRASTPLWKKCITKTGSKEPS